MKITDIKNQRHRKNRFSIYIDGKYRFSLDYDTLVRANLHIVDEMEDLHYNYGVNEIQDVSDEFNGHLGNAQAICDEKLRRGLGIPWKTLVRAHPLPGKLVQAMSKSGCWQVSIGIESGNQGTIDGIGKRFTMEQLTTSLSLLQAHDIRVQGLFMLFKRLLAGLMRLLL